MTADVFLNPGEYFVGDRRHRVRTLLGSCVSITLWDPVLRVGAMSHFLLAARASAPSAALDARYAVDAFALMLAGLSRHGVPAHRCEAKIFGGGQMFAAQGVFGDVGQRNGETALRLLDEAGIVVRSQSLFGAGHRRILFDIGSGHVWSCQVRPADMADA